MPDPIHTLTTEPLALRVVDKDGDPTEFSVDDLSEGRVEIGLYTYQHNQWLGMSMDAPTPALLAFARAVVERCGDNLDKRAMEVCRTVRGERGEFTSREIVQLGEELIAERFGGVQS